MSGEALSSSISYVKTLRSIPLLSDLLVVKVLTGTITVLVLLNMLVFRRLPSYYALLNQALTSQMTLHEAYHEATQRIIESRCLAILEVLPQADISPDPVPL